MGTSSVVEMLSRDVRAGRLGETVAFMDLDVELPAWGDPADGRELRPSSLVDEDGGLSHP